MRLCVLGNNCRQVLYQMQITLSWIYIHKLEIHSLRFTFWQLILLRNIPVSEAVVNSLTTDWLFISSSYRSQLATLESVRDHLHILLFSPYLFHEEKKNVHKLFIYCSTSLVLWLHWHLVALEKKIECNEQGFFFPSVFQGFTYTQHSRTIKVLY